MVIKHIIIPHKVGRRKETIVHFILFVSFFIVSKVVPQGKCNNVNIITLIAVSRVQPFDVKIFPITATFSISINSLFFKYPIKIIGSTISFAGIPKIKAVKIYPSKPIIFANGFKVFAIKSNVDTSPILILENNHITIPAGAAIEIALPNTNRVLSNKERINIFPICGVLYGGSSKVKDDGSPFNIVLDSIFETNNVNKIPNKTTSITTTAATNPENIPAIEPEINIVATVIKNGNLPLQGTKQFVSIAINFSLGEFIILVPTTAAALQPNPIHIVSACLPEVHAHLKHLSKLKAILGKNPKSSRIVNRGKNIAIGGSITYL